MHATTDQEKLQRRIDELEQQMTALQETARKYRDIFNALPLSVQVVDEKGIIAEISPFHVSHIGKGKTTEQDYLNQYICTRPSIIRAGLSEKYRRVLEGEAFYEKDVFFPVTTGGTRAYYNVQGVPVRNGDRISGALFIIEDVTGLNKAQEELRRYSEELEALVEARTADLKQAYDKLHHENAERKKAEGEREQLIVELQEALKQVKLLSGFLPICSSCKKIRDDGGKWRQIESYIQEHSQAEFSHGICPDCARRLYPGI